MSDQDQRPWDPDELVELLPVATPVIRAALPWPPPADVRTSVCEVCSTNIFYQPDEDHGGWWIHQHHPEDGHDATSVMRVRGKAVIVLEIETGPDRIHDAVSEVARFARELADQTLFGPTMHVAIEDKAEEVLKVFEKAPEISESES